MNWMLKPVTAVECKVGISTLEAAELPWYESAKDVLYSTTMDTLQLFGIPYREDFHAFVVWSHTSTTLFSDKSLFGGIVSEGLIVIENMFRVDGGAYISDMALAMYRQFYAVDKLNQIVVCNVTNDDTVQFLTDDLYTEQNNLNFDGRAGVKKWPYPTPEYLALLSTPVCSVAVNIVLGAWPRGTHYISNIQTGEGGRNRGAEINIMLEIEKIPADLTKMPKLAKETKAALLEAMDMDPSLLDSESSKASESGEGGESKKRKPEESEKAGGSEPAAKKKKKPEEPKKRKAEESKEAKRRGATKRTKTDSPRKSSRIAKKADKEAVYDSELDAEGETDSEFEPAPAAKEEKVEMEVDEGDKMDVDVEEEKAPGFKPAPKQAKGKGRAPRKAPVPKKGGKK